MYVGFTSIKWSSNSGRVEDAFAFVVDTDGKLYESGVGHGQGVVCEAEYGPAWGGGRSFWHLGEVLFTGYVKDNFAGSDHRSLPAM